MDNEIKNVFFDIEMLRRRLIRPFFIELGLTVGQGQPRILKELSSLKTSVSLAAVLKKAFTLPAILKPSQLLLKI